MNAPWPPTRLDFAAQQERVSDRKRAQSQAAEIPLDMHNEHSRVFRLASRKRFAHVTVDNGN
jgi:hypothetical protein